MLVESIELDAVYQDDLGDFIWSIPKGSVDLVIADPPYFEIVDNEFDRKWADVGDYIEWSMYWLESLHRVLKPTASVYLWGAIGYNRGYALPKICNLIEQRAWKQDIALEAPGMTSNQPEERIPMPTLSFRPFVTSMFKYSFLSLLV